MKVTEFGQNAQFEQAPRQERPVSAQEPARIAVSVENRGATSSPSTMDAAPFDDKDRLKEAMLAAERLSEASGRRLRFEYQEEADVFQVSVVDENDEVVRKIPADCVLRLKENIERILLGLSVDTTA